MNPLQIQPFGMMTQQAPMGMMQQQAALPATLAPLTAQLLKDRKNAIRMVMKSVMVEGTHFGKVTSGANAKPSLWKAGAECLCTTFHLAPLCESRVVGDDLDAEWSYKFERYNQETREKFIDEGTCFGFFEVESICTMLGPNGNILARASARCSNRESKYRTQAMPETRNTVQKMSEKRAFVAATLMSTGASDIFTQDLEDLDLSGSGSPAAGNGGGAAIVSALSLKQKESAEKGGLAAGVHPQVVAYAVAHVSKAEVKEFMDTIFLKTPDRVEKIKAAFEPYAAVLRAKIQAEKDKAAAAATAAEAKPAETIDPKDVV